MALRAGYVGIKKSMLGLINSLTNAKIIKTVGNGLKLTNAGTMSVNIDTDTLEFVNGKLTAKSKGVVYDVSEEITSQVIGIYKDANGEKPLKRAYITFDSVTLNNWNRKDVSSLNVAKAVQVDLIVDTLANGQWGMGYRDGTKYFMGLYDPALGASFFISGDTIFTGCKVILIMDYIETEV